jgi:cell division protein FtsL
MLKLSFASLAIAVLAACVVYGFKGQVQSLEQDLRRVERAIERERFEITRLDAEWATLSEPARLARLAKEHLGLGQPLPQQLASSEDIPLRSDLEQPDGPALVSSTPSDHVSATAAVSAGPVRR